MAIELLPHSQNVSAVQLSERPERITFQGVTVEVLVSSETTGGLWSLLSFTAPAGYRGPSLHVHRELTETFYVMAGRLRLRLDGEQRELGVGEVAVVPPGRVHTYSNPYDEPMRLLLLCSPGGLEGYFRAVADRVARAPTWPPLDLTGLTSTGEAFDIFLP